MTIFKFLCICLIPLLGNSSEDFWFQENGLIEEVTFVVIAIFCVEIIKILLFPSYLVKLIIRNWEKRKGEKSDITQLQANEVFQNDHIMLGTSLSTMIVF